MTDLWRDFWIRETGTGQQVAQLHDRYMMMMMITKLQILSADIVMHYVKCLDDVKGLPTVNKLLKIILIYIQTRCNVTQFILSGNCYTCFGWWHHPSSGAQTTVSTASVICHTVTATCRYRGRVGTGLSVLWVVYAAGSSNGMSNNRCCRNSRLRSWWWVVAPPETCRADSR